MKKILLSFVTICLSISVVFAFAGCEADKDEKLALTDFIIEVEKGRDIVVLQLTDPQIIDAAQEREEEPEENKLDAYHLEYWGTDKVEDRCYKYIHETIEATNPDFIIMTGDIIYGRYDDNGTALLDFIEFMESFAIPWAPVMGNHDAETKKGIDWVCEQFENAENCLFKQGELEGNSNYSVGIMQGNELKRVFFMLDSNGSNSASEESRINGQTGVTSGLGIRQMQWYYNAITEIKEISPKTKISFAFHIPMHAYYDAAEKYCLEEEIERFNIDTFQGKDAEDFGYLGHNDRGEWDFDDIFWSELKELGVDSVFVGHVHCNSSSIVHEGIRLQYGQKSSTYASFNVKLNDGTIIESNTEQLGTPLIGGTVIQVSKKDGAIIEPYIYLCKD